MAQTGLANLLPYDGEVFYYGPLFGRAENDEWLTYFLGEIPWEHDELVMFGKPIMTDRRIAWFGDQDLNYRYSGRDHLASAWTPELARLKAQIEEKCGETFNSCLMNLYDDGSQGMGWHRDNQKELGKDPVIASVSFGAERRFDFRHCRTKEKVFQALEHGSLLVMKGSCQHDWQHQIAKTKKVTTPRVNLTFRTILT